MYVHSVAPESLASLRARLHVMKADLSHTKAQMGVILAGSGSDHQEETINPNSKKYECLETENELLRRQCASLRSRLEDTNDELEKAQDTIDDFTRSTFGAYQFSGVRGNPYSFGRGITGNQGNTMSDSERNEQRAIVSKITVMYHETGSAKARLKMMSLPGFKKGYAIRCEDWVDSAEIDLNFFNLRTEIKDNLSRTLEDNSVLMGYDELPRDWAHDSYGADQASKDLIGTTAEEVIQNLYDDLTHRRLLSAHADTAKPTDLKWQVACHRRDDKRGSTVIIWGNPSTEYEKELARVELDDPPVCDEKCVRVLRANGYDERGRYV